MSDDTSGDVEEDGVHDLEEVEASMGVERQEADADREFPFWTYKPDRVERQLAVTPSNAHAGEPDPAVSSSVDP